MKTIEELEAELANVTRERDLSLSAWESAGMQGRTAQSAMLELARQLEDAQADVAAAKTALDDVGWLEDERDKARAWAHQCERERDEARAEVERLMHQLADQTNETTRARLEAKREADMLQDRLSEARSEVDRLTDERDELLVRVANQDAELRATREAYRDAYRRGAEAMRGECIGAACGFFMGTTGFCNGDEDELEAVLEALPIPEEP